MIARVTAQGLQAARRNQRLAVTLWLFNLALALAAGVPGWWALSDATGSLPGADSARSGADERRRTLLRASGAAPLASVPACCGSARSRSCSPGSRPASSPGPLVALSRYARRESGSDWLALALLLAALAAGGLVVLLALLVQDAARVLIVREDARRVLPRLRGAAALVPRHLAKWLGTWGLNGVLLLLVFGAYLALVTALSGRAWLPLLIVVQQLFVLLRCALRVALLGAEVALVSVRCRSRNPRPQPAVEAPPEPA